jgi:hypothetical protein
MKKNTIIIVFDELTCYKNLPKEITDNLKGYQLFRALRILNAGFSIWFKF